jgi:peptide/nickel transport system substrate-binding protein
MQLAIRFPPMPRSRTLLSITASLIAAIACQPAKRPCTGCGTAVVAAVGEPSSILPPLVYETVGRDIGDLIFERLADLEAGGSPVDTGAFVPRLASRWERLDSLTWRFHLRRDARWQDGRPVTAEDVRFSFDAFADSVLDAPARLSLFDRIQVQVEDARTVIVRFAEPSPEQLYDATFHVRIIPAHIWSGVPRESWSADTSAERIVGSGRYRLRRWKRGQHLVLEADTTGSRQPHIGRLVWRFTGNPDAALNLVLSGDADLLETLGSPQNARRFEGDTLFELRSYPAAFYGFLAFRIADNKGRAHPLFGNRDLRRALSSGVDRATVAKALFGEASEAPNGPMSQLLWINDRKVAVLPFDTAAASRLLDEKGWRQDPSGSRMRSGQPLAFDILVPSSSGMRKQAALMLQESWRRLGARVSVTAVDFPVFQERISKGQFDTYIGAYLDQPSARGLAEGWTRAGWAGTNYGRYGNPVFDSLLDRAARQSDPAGAKALYRVALDTLNADAPALFLYAPSTVAAVRRTFGRVRINPYSWISEIPDWIVTSPAQILTAKTPPKSP